MLNFYDIEPEYTEYLRQYERKIPNIVYGNNNKFLCGIVLEIGKYDYFAPISSNKIKQQTNLLIKDKNNRQILASIKFSFMLPAPNSVIKLKDFKSIRKVDSAYADLLEKEFEFCRKNEDTIRNKAEKIYKIGCNPNHNLHKYCCNFPLLETKLDEWLTAQEK